MTDKSSEMNEGTKAPEDVEIIEEEQVKDPLEEAREEARKYLDMARRIQADFDNFRKRTQRENEEFRKYANSGLISDLLTIVDDLDRALGTVEEETDLSTGIRGVRTNMMKVLEANGVKEIPCEGKFDPNFHEALCAVEGEEDDMIAEVFLKGYTLNGKVLRYSKVKVTRKTA